MLPGEARRQDKRQQTQTHVGVWEILLNIRNKSFNKEGGLILEQGSREVVEPLSFELFKTTGQSSEQKQNQMYPALEIYQGVSSRSVILSF